MHKILFGVVLLCLAGAAVGGERVSRPFEYSGYGTAQFSAQQRVAVYVPMSDGTQLAATIFLPADGPRGQEFPALVWYLPGHRESIDPKTGELRPYGSPEQIRFFTSHGYAWVIAEMRGSGASFGTRFDRGPQIGRDGKELIDWLATQSWSNGNVGMVGLSYQGFSQYATAAQRPQALKAIFPEIAGFDEYSIMFYPGGIQNIAMSSAAVSSITRDDQNHYLPQPSAGPPALPSAPVIDEDGDGELADEIPLDRNGNGSFLDEGAPAYSDGNQRDDIYYRATLAHVRNVNLTADLVGQAIFRDSTIPGSPYTYADLGPGTKPAEIAASGIAVYNRAGWLDYHARCATQWFASLNGRTPVKLLFAPSVHGGFPGGGRSGAGPYWRHFATPQTERDLDIEKLRFFDRYLKGVDNGIDREPPVYLYVMGSGWRAEQEWPLARAVTQRWYFSDDHALTNRRRGSGIDQYRVDLSADSRHEGANRWNFRLAGAKEPMQATQQDLKRLIYETAPLEGDMEVTGHPLIELAVSSTADDGDFFVYLEDVDPQGRVLSVTDGQLRASFWKQAANDTMVNAGPGRRLDVKPELPWHGFTRAGQDPEVFAHGRVATLKFDLMPTAWLFRKGHRIRVAIAGADWPTFQLHPLLSPQNQPRAPDNLSPTINVHRTKARPSWISLPVIPAD